MKSLEQIPQEVNFQSVENKDLENRLIEKFENYPHLDLQEKVDVARARRIQKSQRTGF